MFCKECGRNIANGYICPFCGTVQKLDESVFYKFNEYGRNIFGESKSSRSRLSAGILQILCGVAGIGRFYMGYNTYAVMQLVVSVLTCGIGGVVWGIFDGIMILNGTVRYDADGKLME